MHIVFPRQQQCPRGTAYYVCNSGQKFTGCCSVDPCNPSGCPGNQQKSIALPTATTGNNGAEPHTSTAAKPSITSTRSSILNSEPPKPTYSPKVAASSHTTNTLTKSPSGSSKASSSSHSSTASLELSTTASSTHPTLRSSTSAGPSVSTTAFLSIPTPERVSSAKSSTGGIAGGIVGGLSALLLIGLVVFFLSKRKRKENTGMTRRPPIRILANLHQRESEAARGDSSSSSDSKHCRKDDSTFLANVSTEYHRDSDSPLHRYNGGSSNDEKVVDKLTFTTDYSTVGRTSNSAPTSSQYMNARWTDKSDKRDQSPLSPGPEPEQGVSRTLSTSSGFIPISIGRRQEPPLVPPVPDHPSGALGWLDKIVDERQSRQYIEESSTRIAPSSPVQASQSSPTKQLYRIPTQSSGWSRMSASPKPSPLGNRPELPRGTWSTASSPTLGRFPSLLRTFRQKQGPSKQSPTSIREGSGNGAAFPGDGNWL